MLLYEINWRSLVLLCRCKGYHPYDSFEIILWNYDDQPLAQIEYEYAIKNTAELPEQMDKYIIIDGKDLDIHCYVCNKIIITKENVAALASVWRLGGKEALEKMVIDLGFEKL